MSGGFLGGFDERCKHRNVPGVCGKCDEERKAAKALAERRERIATVALQGLLASDSGERSINRQTWWSHAPAEAAECAVELADALIAQLDRARLS